MTAGHSPLKNTLNGRYAIPSFLGKCPAKISIFLRMDAVQSMGSYAKRKHGDFEERVNKPNVVGRQEWAKHLWESSAPALVQTRARHPKEAAAHKMVGVQRRSKPERVPKP